MGEMKKNENRPKGTYVPQKELSSIEAIKIASKTMYESAKESVTTFFDYEEKGDKLEKKEKKK